jgi:hypothetical protein
LHAADVMVWHPGMTGASPIAVTSPVQKISSDLTWFLTESRRYNLLDNISKLSESFMRDTILMLNAIRGGVGRKI